MSQKNKKLPAKKKAEETAIRFPASVLKPVAGFLVKEEREILKKLHLLSKEDPFANPTRLTDNAAPDNEALEQIDHLKNQSLQEQLKKNLIQVRRALTRLKIGKYGICEECGQMIDTDRLMIYPHATLCVKCEQKKKK
ncbi:TraR/DksA C4-type zinc finger protein [Candidatus Shapirobacteria bacterium]|nr:TraR/DksA C4-type zinc finger protein [Candidatus Shapirobacteria bacterium]